MCCFFFFFKQKTAYEMRISDWSSDVCSSDLMGIVRLGADKALVLLIDRPHRAKHHLAGLLVVAPGIDVCSVAQCAHLLSRRAFYAPDVIATGSLRSAVAVGL